MFARRRVFLIVLVVCGCSAAVRARTAEGLFLTWNDCALASGSTHDFSSSCLSNLGWQDLLCTFRMPFPTDSVLGVEIVVDVQHANATLPDWWRLDNVGCRAGELRAETGFSPSSPCVDFFLGNAADGVQGYYLTEPRGGTNQASIRVAASTPPASCSTRSWRRQPGATGGDVFLSVPGQNDANWVTWQGGAGANCSAVPVRSVTWGRLKGLYR